MELRIDSRNVFGRIPSTRLSRITGVDAPPPQPPKRRSCARYRHRSHVQKPAPPSDRTPGRIPSARAAPTGAIRTLGSNPATAPIMLHPGDAIPHRRRVLYIVLLGALTALGPFTIDLYLPAFPVLESDFQTTAAAIQLTLTGTMIGFALGQLIVGPLSDKVGRRIPLLSVTALHVVASVARRPGADARTADRSPACCMGMGAAAGGVVADGDRARPVRRASGSS